MKAKHYLNRLLIGLAIVLFNMPLAAAGRFGIDLDLSFEDATWCIYGFTGVIEDEVEHNGDGYGLGVSLFYAFNDFIDVRTTLKRLELSTSKSDTELNRIGIGVKVSTPVWRKIQLYYIYFMHEYWSIEADESGSEAREVGSVEGKWGAGYKFGATYSLSENKVARIFANWEELDDDTDTTVRGTLGT